MVKRQQPPINMNFFKVSRKRINVGDIFAYQMKVEPGLFRYGRVIRTDAEVGPMKDVILLYLYSATSKNKENIPSLDKNRLLIPPCFINRLPWSSAGVFETVANRHLDENDILDVHCFKNPIYETKDVYTDEYGNFLELPSEPIGFLALDSYRSLDDRISYTLGIPESPLVKGDPGYEEQTE